MPKENNRGASIVRSIMYPRAEICTHGHKASKNEFRKVCERHCPSLLEHFEIESIYNGTVHSRKVLLAKTSDVTGHLGVSHESEIKSKTKPYGYKGEPKTHQDLEPVDLNTIARLSMIPGLRNKIHPDLLHTQRGRFVLPTSETFKNISILFEFSIGGYLFPTVHTSISQEMIPARDLLVMGDTLFSTVF